jgi:TolA-binding protein
VKPTTHGPSPEDLSARSRRGHASAEEERELHRALESSATLRVAHRVGLDLDLSTAVRAGDEELVMAAADAALRRVNVDAAASGVASGRVVVRAGSRKNPRKIAAALVAAATISASGMAAAWWAGIAKISWHVDDAPAPAEATHAAPHKGHFARAKAPPIEEPARPEEAAPEPGPAAELAQAPEIEKAPEQRAPERAARRINHAGTEGTAAEIFRNANAARRAGDFGDARRLYTRLIGKYPGTDEARLSQVSLGKLLLASGEAAEAEREFRHYLSNGRQPLAEEALVNQAESLHAMSRGGDERKTWLRLLADHPNSVYAARARARLAALERESPVPGP